MPSVQSQLFRLALKYYIAPRFNPMMPLAEQRALQAKLNRQAKLPAGVAMQKVNAWGTAAEWLCAPGVNEEQVILYLHGGLTSGLSNAHRDLAARLSRASRAWVLLPEYRLAPEHPFPAALEDVITVYHWLLAEGFEPRNIVVAGDFAGAGLGLSLLVSLRDTNMPLPAAYVALSPWYDLDFTGESYQTNAQLDPVLQEVSLRRMAGYYLGENNPRSPLVSPLYAGLRGLPPMFIQVGSDELLLSDALRVAARAKASDVEIELEVGEGLWHGWPMAGSNVPEARQAVNRLATFIQARLGEEAQKMLEMALLV